MLINVDYTITYFLPISPAPCLVLERDLVAQRLSRTAPCRVLYSSTCIDCWPLLTQENSLSPILTIRGSYSPRPNPLSGFPVGHRSVDIYRVSSFFRWVWSVRPFSTPTVASILWLRIKTPPRPFWGKHGRLVIALGWLWQSLVWFLLPAYLLRWGYRFPLEVSRLSAETLEPVSDLKKLGTWRAQLSQLYCRHVIFPGTRDGK